MAGIIYLAEDAAISFAEQRKDSSSPRLIFIALLISLVLHLVVMVWYHFSSVSPVQLAQPEYSPLKVNLTLATMKLATEPREPIEPVLPATSSIEKESISEPEAVTQTVPVRDPTPSKDEAPRPSEDLQTVIRRSSTIPDKYRLLAKDIAPPTAGSSRDGIFDPRVREKLRAAHRDVPGARTPMEVTSIHGETIVRLNEGGCMSGNGQQDSVTRASDWYLTECDDVKTEGELIMDRVNQQLRARR